MTILHNVKRLNLEKTVSKLAAVDGFSNNSISKSKFKRACFLSKGRPLPKSPSSIVVLIHDYYSKIELYIEKFGAFKSENKKMSICIDEWTNCRNRR
jgi:hypothetical protein